jgi:hypothetical protein
MKLSIRLVASFVFLCSQISIAQNSNEGQYDRFKVLPSEKVYVSTNTNVLLTGEYLFYKVYCLDDKTKQPSETSKIAYVELISEDFEVVFSEKIRLEKSQGQGDFFVPTTVASGNYKLIAYTRWMKNGSMNLFFQDDISIINPYQGNQDAILPNVDTADINTNMTGNAGIAEDKRFIISTDKETYSKKSKVQLGLKNFRGAAGYGNYNISVRKKEAIVANGKHTPESFISWHEKQASNNTLYYDKITFGPEIEGELIKGQLRAKDGSSSTIGKKIGVSIPGKDFQLKVVRTDSTGVFHVSITNEYTEPLAIFQVLEESKGLYDITIEQDPKLDYTSLVFKNFYMDASMKEAIVNRSVQNQIENGFFAVKPDTVSLDKLNDPYGGAYIEVVNLDEYTRFKTLDETIVELVPNVWTKKIKNGESVFKARSFDETYEESEFDALVYIDGVLVANPNDVLDFNTRTVARINTVREKYRMGGKTYFGMVNIETIEGNYFEQISGDGITKTNLTRTKPLKKYFAQTYNEESNRRIPDFRDQLLWKPDLTFEGTEMELSFYTSEIAGDYEVVLEGFSIYGRPVNIKKSFVVN